MANIRRTQKYLKAVEVAKSLGLTIWRKAHTADEVYTEIESLYYWDSRQQAWVEHAKVDPAREMDKTLIRVRVTAHMTYLQHYADRVIEGLKEAGFTVQEISKQYPNVRDVDGAGRIYITARDID